MSNRKFNRHQRAYMLAKAYLESLEHQEREVDQSYIAKHNIINSDGSIPRASWAIDDKVLADKAITECSKQVEESGLWSSILEAREQLKNAEENLLKYGLSIVPKREKEVLEEAVQNNYTIRMRVIDLTMRLDPRTVTA